MRLARVKLPTPTLKNGTVNRSGADTGTCSDTGTGTGTGIGTGTCTGTGTRRLRYDACFLNKSTTHLKGYLNAVHERLHKGTGMAWPTVSQQSKAN
jgi:hypothetical protein